MTAAVAQQITCHRNISSRWERASERARIASVQVTAIDDLGTYRVNSATYPGVSYESDGTLCTCQAAANGDPVCLHRAAVRDHIAAQQSRCPVCNGTGVEFISIWDWKAGCAVNLYSQPCECTTDRAPEPAPGVAELTKELEETEAELAESHDRLYRLNVILNRDGRLSSSDYRELCREGDRNRALHDRIREIKAQLAAQIVLVAA